MNDLDDLLHDSGRDLTLRTPLSDVTARGATLRHRRNARRGAVTATAALALVGGGLVVAATTGSGGPGDAPSDDLVAAGWSSSLQGLSADDAAAYTDLCRTFGNDMVQGGVEAGVPAAATDVFNTAPVASTPLTSSGDDVAVLVFRSGRDFANCVVTSFPGGDLGVSAAQSLPRFTETGEHVSPTGAFGSSASDESLATGLVGPDVDAVHIVMDGTPVGATVDDGVFVAMVPTSSPQIFRAATVEAYDADGTLLETVPLVP